MQERCNALYSCAPVGLVNMELDLRADLVPYTTLQKQKGHFNPADGGISVASSLPKNVNTGRSITLFAQHNTFMALIIKEIRTAKPKRLL